MNPLIIPTTDAPRFNLGRLLYSPGVHETIPREEHGIALGRHIAGDWGDLDDEDKKKNDRALEEGGRLFSAYTSASGTRFYCITQADRSSTILMLPEEY